MTCIDEYLDCAEARAMVLSAVRRSQPIGIRKISKECGIPVHRVRYVLKALTDAGAVRATAGGEVLGCSWEAYLADMANEISDCVRRLDAVSVIIMDEITGATGP